MLLALLVAVVAVAIGVGIGLARTYAHRTLGPVRTFALVAAFATVVFELLPRAVAGGGLAALATFAGAAALPWVAERLGARVASHRSAGLRLEIGYLGLLVHHVGDGLGLGTFAGGAHAGHAHWDVLLAIGGHTVPVTAVVVLAYGRRATQRVAALRGGLFAVAIAAGIALTHAVPAASFARIEPYVTAAVAGLLLHVATHDWLEDPPITGGARLLDLLAATVGIVVVAVAGAAHEHEHEHGAMDADDVPAIALRLACRYAPALLAATVLGALLERSTPPRPTRGGPVLAAILGATAGGGPERGIALADCWKGERRSISIAFAMGSAGIALETLAALSSAFGPAFAASWAALSAVAIGLVAALSGAAPREGATLAVAAPAPHAHAHDPEHGHDHGHGHGHGHGHEHHEHGHHHERAGTEHAVDGRVGAPRLPREGWLVHLERSFGRVGAPAILGVAMAAVLELGLREASVASLARSRLDVVVLPLMVLMVAVPPLAWVPPLLVLVDRGAYAPAALAAICIAATQRPAIVAWGKIPLRARAAGFLLVVAVSAGLAFLRWPASPARQHAVAIDPIGLVCAAVLGALTFIGLVRRGVRPWLALGIGTRGHDHGPCFEESARVTPVPSAEAASRAP